MQEIALGVALAVCVVPGFFVVSSFCCVYGDGLLNYVYWRGNLDGLGASVCKM